MKYVVAILGLAVLMVVHEAGHYFAARAGGLRVTKFSIGFGPTLFKVQPDGGYWVFSALGDRVKFRLFKHGSQTTAPSTDQELAEPREPNNTIFQVAVIPFLAYVQIAGMNPLEENDPNDRGSYANAKLRTRIATIFAGPLANYLVASMFFFFPLSSRGVPTAPTQIRVAPEMPAAEAGLKDGDQIIAVDGEDVKSDWDKMSSRIIHNADKPIEVVVLREDQAGTKERLTFEVTPRVVGEDKERAKIGVSMYGLRPAKNVGEVALAAVVLPPTIVVQALKNLGELVRGKSEAKLAGPKGMVDAMAEHYETGWVEFMLLLGQISTLLAVFNLLPIPALDGGRLLFLGYEATTRKRPNPTVEAHIHAIGLLMMLGLMVYVTLANDFGLAGGK
jgi:regulator of sigma E protease